MIGRIAAARRSLPPRSGSVPLPWRLRALPVCASTERELDRWLADEGLLAPAAAPAPLQRPLAVIARRQRFGRGQGNRLWCSPAGGVWLSAALPWPADAPTAASPALAVAVGLCLELEALGLRAGIKWPNDLMLPAPDQGWRKLAGLLPGLRQRAGRVRWARMGVGLNGRNPVPPGATNLLAHLGAARTDPLRLAARVLAALEWAVAWADRPEPVRQLAERRLVLPREPLWLEGEAWQPHGLSPAGGLVLTRDGRSRVLTRRFPGRRP